MHHACFSSHSKLFKIRHQDFIRFFESLFAYAIACDFSIIARTLHMMSLSAQKIAAFKRTLLVCHFDQTFIMPYYITTYFIFVVSLTIFYSVRCILLFHSLVFLRYCFIHFTKHGEVTQVLSRRVTESANGSVMKKHFNLSTVPTI